MMKNAGVSPAIVQDIIGHESAEISAHYTHVESAAKRTALESLPDLTRPA
jgi:site-specific recombinase XerD